MSVPDDVHLLARRIDNLTRTANKIRRQLPDLHVVAYEPASRDEVQVRSSQTDYTPRAGDPRAQELWSSISLRVDQVEAVLVGLERALMGYFHRGSENPKPTRGWIGEAELNRQLANQRKRRANGEYTPAPLIDQQKQPGGAR